MRKEVPDSEVRQPREAPRVLVIGVSNPLLRQLEGHLRETGYCVETADDAGRGMTRVRDFLPDVFILDRRLLDAEGWDAVQLQTLLQLASDGSERADLRLSVEGLEMDLRRHEAWVDGRSLRLTPLEFRLLWTIARDPGNVYNRQQLGRCCRKQPHGRRERTIDVHIKSLRTKLGERADLIQTVHGIGYRLGCSGIPEGASCPLKS